MKNHAPLLRRRPLAAAPTIGGRHWLALCAVAAASAAQAQVMPQTPGVATSGIGPYVGASQVVGHDSNLFKVRDGTTETPDIYFVTSLLAGINQPIGRQRLYADATLRAVRFQDVQQLDSEAYSLSAGLDWETVGELSGNLSATARQTLADYSIGGISTNELNLERAQELRANLVWGAQQRLGAEVAGSTSNLDYSNRLAAAQRLRQGSAYAGLRYRSSDALRFGAGVRFTEGKYPDFFPAGPGSFAPLDFERRDVDFTVTWVPTGASSLDARLSATDQSFEQDPSRDVDGLTGALTWNFRPSGRLLVRTTVSRETGAGATFQQLGTAGTAAVGDNSGIATGLRLGVTYEVTAKVSAEAGLGTTRREFRGAVGGSETLNQLQLAARWAFSRAIGFGCQVANESRSTDSALSYDFSATNVLCYGQIVLR